MKPYPFVLLNQLTVPCISGALFPGTTVYLVMAVAGFFISFIAYSSKEFRQPCKALNDEPSDHDSNHNWLEITGTSELRSLLQTKSRRRDCSRGPSQIFSTEYPP